MKYITYIFLFIVLIGLGAKKPKPIKFIDVYKQYMQMDTLFLKVTTKKTDVFDQEPSFSSYYVKQYREANTKKFDMQHIGMLYYYSNYTVTEKQGPNDSFSKVYMHWNDSTENWPNNTGKWDKCTRVVGSTNLYGFINPFSSCFYSPSLLLKKLQSSGESYTISNKNQTFVYWINKKTLLIDSILFSSRQLEGDTIFSTYIFDYYYSVSKSTGRVDYKSTDNEVMPFEFNSLRDRLKAVPRTKPEAIDTVSIIKETRSESKLLLYDFWFIGCRPCLLGMPFVQSLRDSFSNSQLEIIAYNPYDKPNAIENFKNFKKYTFQMEKDSASRKIRAFNVGVFPTKILFDSEGNELLRQAGHTKENEKELLQSIKAYLQESK
jgi:thiol-disulfide isomerase/thioredoxin